MSTNNSEVTDKQREAMNSMWDEVNHSQGASSTKRFNVNHSRYAKISYSLPCVRCGITLSVGSSEGTGKNFSFHCPSCGRTYIITARKPLIIRIFNVLIYILGIILFLAIVLSVLVSYGVFSV